LYSDIGLKLDNLFIFAHANKDVDTADSAFQALAERTEGLMVEFGAAAAFITPYLSSLSDSELKEMKSAPEFENFTTFLNEILREKKHILSVKEEKILAEVRAFAKDFKNIFNAFNNTDMVFGDVVLPNGEREELTHGTYSTFLQHADQNVRKAAFETCYKAYDAMKFTTAATYAGNVRKNVSFSKIRGYKNALSKALYGEGITEEVYNSLLGAIENGLPALHRYIALRKTALGVDTLNMYDMHVPITKEARLELEYDDAYSLVVEALKPLGEDYVELLKRAYNERWIDVRETKNKRSGAYCWGSYTSHPIVLLNYKKTAHDVFTIAHEMGHALHSYYSNKTQVFEKAGYPIFLAEIVSTVNEYLLLKHLLKTTEGEMKTYFLSYGLDMFRTTMFRQAMFAEFEKIAHQNAEKGNPITVNALSEEYLKLNKKYYGDAVKHNEQIALEWQKIPHFYNAFYVYKYATGLATAVNIANKILTDKSFKNIYLKFLASGGSEMPLDTLKTAGIDLSGGEAFETAMQEFEGLLGLLETELSRK
jgi:oligoendopeptidase F